MSRMWEIRENASRSGRSGRSYDNRVDYDGDESYECGYDDGYRAAMKAMGRRRTRRDDDD